MDYAKPLPAIDNWNRPFWEHARQGRLSGRVCLNCGHMAFPPGPVCPACLSDAHEWRVLSGKGRVASWIVFHQLYYKGFADDLPYNVALIELDEGPRLISNVIGVANEALRTDMPVEAVFVPATDEVSIPRFRPAG